MNIEQTIAECDCQRVNDCRSTGCCLAELFAMDPHSRPSMGQVLGFYIALIFLAGVATTILLWWLFS